jgi:hypothetical protein
MQPNSGPERDFRNEAVSAWAMKLQDVSFRWTVPGSVIGKDYVAPDEAETFNGSLQEIFKVFTELVESERNLDRAYTRIADAIERTTGDQEIVRDRVYYGLHLAVTNRLVQDMCEREYRTFDQEIVKGPWTSFQMKIDDSLSKVHQISHDVTLTQPQRYQAVHAVRLTVDEAARDAALAMDWITAKVSRAFPERVEELFTIQLPGAAPKVGKEEIASFRESFETSVIDTFRKVITHDLEVYKKNLKDFTGAFVEIEESFRKK